MSALTRSATRTKRSPRPRPRRSRRSASSSRVLSRARVLCRGRGSELVELALEVLDPLGNEIVGDLALDRAREDRLGSGDGGIGCGRANVGKRLRFGWSDLASRHLGAPRDEFFDLCFGFGRQPLRLGLGAGDDRLRFLLGFLLLAPIGREQGFRFCLEPARFVEFRLDAVAAVVDALHQRLVHAEIAEHGDKDDERGGDPEFGFEHGVPQRLSTLPTASATSWLAGAVPVSRWTIAAAASLAMP